MEIIFDTCGTKNDRNWIRFYKFLNVEPLGNVKLVAFITVDELPEMEHGEVITIPKEYADSLQWKAA